MTAPVPVRNIFWSKFLVIAGLSFVTQVLFFALYLAAGFYFRLSVPGAAGCDPLVPVRMDWLPPGCGDAALFCHAHPELCGAGGDRVCLQRRWVPIGCKGLVLCFPNALVIAGMGAVSQEALGQVDMGIFFVMCAVFTALFCGLSLLVLKRADVKS